MKAKKLMKGKVCGQSVDKIQNKNLDAKLDITPQFNSFLIKVENIIDAAEQAKFVEKASEKLSEKRTEEIEELTERYVKKLIEN